MSNTKRKTDYGWEYGTPEFDAWNETKYGRKVKSRKDQTRDRPPKGKQGGKHGRFQNHGKNCKYNLEQKNEQFDPNDIEY